MKWMGSILLIIALSLFSQGAWAQYPAKPINVLVGFSTGGSTDLTVRAICQSASKILGQPLVVLNKPGSASAVALSLLKNEKPDGYTIGHVTIGGVLNQYFLKVNYDTLTDFTYIMGFGYYVLGVAVLSESPWKTMADLVNYAQVNPGKIKFSSTGAGSIQFLVMEALARREKIKWIHVPFKSGFDAVTALLGKHVDVAVAPTEWKPYVDSGRMRLLSTYIPKRIPRYPDVPTWLDLGYDISVSAASGFMGPKGMPAPFVDKLHAAFKQAMDSPEFRRVMDQFDMPIVYMNPEGIYREIKSLHDQWGKFILDLGLRQE
jgi:tripartite-type tricarboxylate transporter receptor subunit TctC